MHVEQTRFLLRCTRHNTGVRMRGRDGPHGAHAFVSYSLSYALPCLRSESPTAFPTKLSRSLDYNSNNTLLHLSILS